MGDAPNDDTPDTRRLVYGELAATSGNTSVQPSSAMLFTEGDELYDDMVANILKATHEVRLESYIFHDDPTGRRIVDALAVRAAQKVRVRVHLDAHGVLGGLSERLVNEMRLAGIEVRFFRPWNWRDPFRYNRRNHRKLLVIDNHTLYLGGFNVHRQSSFRACGRERWKDAHLRLHGTLAEAAGELFDAFWRFGRRRLPRQWHSGPYTLLSNHNLRARRTMMRSLHECFDTSKKTLYLTTPYFVPDGATMRRIKRAAARGVDVRLLVPRKSDAAIVRWAARAAYDSLLRSGVRVYEYLPRMLHAKCFVADGKVAMIGTANMDYRSFFLNYEANLLAVEPALAAQLNEQFERDIEHADEIKADSWKRRPLAGKFFELIGWAVRKWL